MGCVASCSTRRGLGAALGTFFIIVLACAVSGCRTQEPATLLLVGGKVFTSDTTRPWAEAIAIRGEQIVAVGTTTEIRRLAGSGTRVIDVGGRVVVPGFNDAHDHLSGGSPGQTIEMAAEMTNPTGAQVLDSLRAATSRVPAGT